MTGADPRDSLARLRSMASTTSLPDAASSRVGLSLSIMFALMFAAMCGVATWTYLDDSIQVADYR